MRIPLIIGWIGGVGLILVIPAATLADQDPDTELERLFIADSSTFEQDSSFSIFFENDVILLPNENEDRNYTMGLVLQWGGAWVGRSALGTPRRWLDGRLGIAARHEKNARSSPYKHDTIRIGESAFTPDELRIATPQPDDRPYASILYLSTQHQSVSEDLEVALTSELSIGIVGLNIADWFQTTLHEKQQSFPGDSPYSPQGWHLQISEGGEPTARYSVRRQSNLACQKYFDLQWSAEGHVGYYTNVALGGAFRVGFIDSPWWGFNASPITETKVFSKPADEKDQDPRLDCLMRGKGNYELYAWGAGTGRAWVYNALLQGQIKDSEVTISAGDPERLVGEYQVGLTGSIRAGKYRHTLSYAHARRSPEFDSPLRRAHSWGGLYYSVAWPFGEDSRR